MTDDLRELALFAGSGGGILGGRLLGWRTICAVEIDDYCRRVLMQRQDDGLLEPFPIWPDVTTFDGRPWAGCVDIVTGGFPCTDISVAGKGAGIDGQHSGLWREMARVISEVRPRYVWVENTPLLVSRGGVRVVGDLAEMGYGDIRWGVVGAHHAGAPHKRDRFWLLAHSDGIHGDYSGLGTGEVSQQQEAAIFTDLADTDSSGCQWPGPAQSAQWFGDSKSVGAGETMAYSDGSMRHGRSNQSGRKPEQ